MKEIKKIKTKSSKGFSLVELLVVVAILGILSTVGLVSYNGYVSGTKEKSAKNVMQQISLAQTEEYSNAGSYFTQSTGTCTPTDITSNEIEEELFDGGDQIATETGYNICIASTGAANYDIFASEISGNTPCTLTLSRNGNFTRGNDC